MKRYHGRLPYDRKFQIFIFLIGHINVNKGVFWLIISYLQIKSYNVLNYSNCSTDWPFPLSLTFPRPYIFWNVHDSSTFCQKYQGMFKILQWNAMLRKTPTLKNSSVIPKKFSIYRSCINSSIEVLKYN